MGCHGGADMGAMTNQVAPLVLATPYADLAEFTGVGQVMKPNEIPDPVPAGLLGSRAVAPRAYVIPHDTQQSKRALRRVHCVGGRRANWLFMQYHYVTKTCR